MKRISQQVVYREDIVWSPDGSRYAMYMNGKGVCIYSTQDNNLDHCFEHLFQACICWSASGTRLAFERNNTVTVWEPSSGFVKQTIVPGSSPTAEPSVDSMCWVENGAVAVAHNDRVDILPVHTSDAQTIVTDGHRVVSVAWSRKGGLAIYRGTTESLPNGGLHHTQRVDLWKDGVLKTLLPIEVHVDSWPTTKLVWSPEGDRVLIAMHGNASIVCLSGETTDLNVRAYLGHAAWSTHGLAIAIADNRLSCGFVVIRGDEKQTQQEVYTVSALRWVADGTLLTCSNAHHERWKSA